MKRKIKLFGSIVGMVLAMSFMTIGVFAAQNASVGVTTTIAYTASPDVRATIELLSTDTQNCTVAGLLTPDPVVFVGDETADEMTNVGTIALGDLTLTDTTHIECTLVFSYVIQITNNASSDDTYSHLTITVAGPSQTTGNCTYGTTYQDGSASSTWTDNVITIRYQETVTYTVTVNVDNFVSIDGTVDIGSSLVLQAIE